MRVDGYRGALMPEFHTDFSVERAEAFEAPVTRIVTARPDGMPRHVFVPSIHEHSSGQLLATCRWDSVGTSEGDATNEQALYFSLDGGETWTLAGGGPIVTFADGSAFDIQSAITHSLIVEHEGRTWLHFSINQPHTWAPGGPDRATGGGELRRIELRWDGTDWSTDGGSEVTWGFLQPIDDGRGGWATDVRVALEDKFLTLGSGRIITGVGGRSTVPDPRGAFWRLNRCWALHSDDGGRTWSRSALIGGSDSLAIAEPTIVETSTPGSLVCLLRVQYDSGEELHLSTSSDDGLSWSQPAPVGLPNAGSFGARPFLIRLRDGTFALLICSEHGTAGRTGVSVFLTDEKGLLAGRWLTKKTVWIESPGGAGSAAYGVGGYGWMIELESGELAIVFATSRGGEQHISFTRVARDWLEATVIEPVAIRDDLRDDRPTLEACGLRIANARARVRATRFGALDGEHASIAARLRVDTPPADGVFHLCHVSADNGRWPTLSVSLRAETSDTIWLDGNQGWVDTGMRSRGEHELGIEFVSARTARVSIDGVAFTVHTKATSVPSDLTIGSFSTDDSPCDITLIDVGYRS
jgi:hypothetical protein